MALTDQNTKSDQLTFAFNPGKYVDQLVLVANTAQAYSLAAAATALGTNSLLVNIQGESASIAVNFNNHTASFAGASTTNGQAAVINPSQRVVTALVVAGTSLSVISRIGQNASIEVIAA